MRDVEQALTERYAAPPAWRRPSTSWRWSWSPWSRWPGWRGRRSTRRRRRWSRDLLGWDVVDAHAATARIDVTIHDAGAHPTCTVQALASDHSIVGELTFRPTDGTNTVTVRTEREATAVDVPGCIADGQDRPR